LIFYNGTSSSRKVHADDFWSHSWLNYGVVRVHERVFDYLYTTYTGTNASLCSVNDGKLWKKKKNYCVFDVNTVIPNPCSFKGKRQVYSQGGNVFTFEGTGESKKCFNIIEKIVWPAMPEKDKKSICVRGRPCPIDEIEHPSVHGYHFYAMSVYYFALDCMRYIGSAELPYWYDSLCFLCFIFSISFQANSFFS
jgi:hypothetical protein